MAISRVSFLSGPNLDRLGTREPEVYGTETLDEIMSTCSVRAAELSLEVSHFQSASEAEMIGRIHTDTDDDVAGVIINPGAFTHYAWGIHDALASFRGPVIELHLSNPAAREPWRHTSVVTPVSTGLISGFGTTGYRLALEAMAELLVDR